MKPAALVEIALRNSSRVGDLVLDPFARLRLDPDRLRARRPRARLIELDPGYCDVIVERFERLTGTRRRDLMARPSNSHQRSSS